MFEYHGWIRVRDADRLDSLGNRENSPRGETIAEIQELIDSRRPTRDETDRRFTEEFVPAGSGDVLQLRKVNGNWHLMIDGYRNHRQQWIVDLFQEVGRLARGSYGLLHVHDDEHRGEENDWIRWEMRRGEVVSADELSLSPHVPRIEDD